jgi:hypothetical protein
LRIEDGRFGARFVLGGDNEEHPKSVDTSRHKVKGVECFVGSRGGCEAFFGCFDVGGFFTNKR